MARTTIDLVPAILRELKVRQRREAKTLGRLVSELLSTAMQDDDEEPRSATGSRSPGTSPVLTLRGQVPARPPVTRLALASSSAASEGSQNQRSCSKSAPTSSAPPTSPLIGGGPARSVRASSR